jgi:hypothetical protein
MAVYPITFSIPECKLVSEIPVKTKLFSTIIPGDVKTYIFKTEESYYNEYKTSIFAMTTKKGGWDCMRHYEVLANGCIPYFPSIEYCPNTILALLPKELIKEGNALYHKYKNMSMGDINMEKCNILIQKLLDFTRNNLTTKAVAKYFIDKIQVDKQIKRILVLNGQTLPDYLRCSLLHGLKEIFGAECHDSPKIPHIYKSDTINFDKLYGNGYSYTNLLDSSLHNESYEATIEDDIIAMKYDYIVYGSYHRGMPHYDLVQKIYPGNKIILLCGNDTHSCSYDKYLEKGHIMFIREM